MMRLDNLGGDNMSCSLYKWRESCDGDFCPGDCDVCSKADEYEDEEEEE